MKITINIQDIKYPEITIEDERDIKASFGFIDTEEQPIKHAEAKEETCKWSKRSETWARHPHEDSSVWNTEKMTYCHVCGKRIEVVE